MSAGAGLCNSACRTPSHSGRRLQETRNTSHWTYRRMLECPSKFAGREDIVEGCPKKSKSRQALGVFARLMLAVSSSTTLTAQSDLEAVAGIADHLLASSSTTQSNAANLARFIPYIIAGSVCDQGTCILFETEMRVYHVDPDGRPASYLISFYNRWSHHGRKSSITIEDPIPGNENAVSRDSAENAVVEQLRGTVSPNEVHVYRILRTSPQETAAVLQEGLGSVKVHTVVKTAYLDGVDLAASVPMIAVGGSAITKIPFQTDDQNKTVLLITAVPSNDVRLPEDSESLFKVTAYDNQGNILCDHRGPIDPKEMNTSILYKELFEIDAGNRLACLAGKEVEGMLEIWRNKPNVAVLGWLLQYVDLSSAGVNAKLPLSFTLINAHESPGIASEFIPDPMRLRAVQSGEAITVSWVLPPPGSAMGAVELRYRSYPHERQEGLPEGIWHATVYTIDSEYTLSLQRGSRVLTYEFQARYTDGYATTTGNWSRSVKITIER